MNKKRHRMNYIRKLIWGGLSLLMISSIACSSSKDPLPLELEKKVVEIYPEEITSIDIKSGESPYEVIVGDEKLLDAQVTDDNKLVLRGKGATGDLNLVVRDKANQVVGLYVILSEKEVFMEVTGLENQVRIEDEDIKRELENSLAEKPFPVEKGGGYKLIYRDRDKGNLIVYDQKNPSDLWEGTFELVDPYDLKMVYEKKGKKMELNYVIAPDIINPSTVANNLLKSPRWILKEDWTDYYRKELNLLQLEFAAKLQYVKSTTLQ